MIQVKKVKVEKVGKAEKAEKVENMALQKVKVLNKEKVKEKAEKGKESLLNQFLLQQQITQRHHHLQHNLPQLHQAHSLQQLPLCRQFHQQLQLQHEINALIFI